MIKCSPLSYFYLTTSLEFFVVGGLWISIASFKSNDPRLKLKSKFLLVWVILIAFRSILEIYDPMETIMVTYFAFNLIYAAIIASFTAKIILTIAVICSYIGFMLPKRIEKIFLKT